MWMAKTERCWVCLLSEVNTLRAALTSGPPAPPLLQTHFTVYLSGLMMSVHHRLVDKFS